MAQPRRPTRGCRALLLRRLESRQASQNLLQFRHEPGMQDGVRAAGHGLGAQGAVSRAEEGEQLGRPPSDILVGLARRLGLRLPGSAGLGDRLVGAGLILAEQRDPRRFGLAVGLLDQPLFRSVWGSVTVTGPPWRWRTAVPVGHQVRVR